LAALPASASIVVPNGDLETQSAGVAASSTVADAFVNDVPGNDAGVTLPSGETYDISGTDRSGVGPVEAYPAVPKPSTVIAGLSLLLPFGASTLRILRRRQLP
jgi:hypothetical protein